MVAIDIAIRIPIRPYKTRELKEDSTIEFGPSNDPGRKKEFVKSGHRALVLPAGWSNL